MDSLGLIGYTISTVGFLILTVILKASWQGRIQGAVLIIATFINAVWSGVLSYDAGFSISDPLVITIVELIRDGCWLAFLFILILYNEQKTNGTEVIRVLALIATSLIILELGYSIVVVVGQIQSPKFIAFDVRIITLIILSVIGLTLVEQLFRNSKENKRWAIKFLCLGIGGLFAFDFYLYADALLLKRIDYEIWDTRGYINLMVMPLIAVSAARNPQWSLDVFVSRKIVFHTTALMSAGIYLLAMAAGGYYIKLYGGNWGSIAQIVFLFGALLVLGLLLFSGQIRAQFRVFLSKHFFNYRYDYREEWLKFINTLADDKLDTQTRERVIHAIADIVDSPAGVLWLLREPNCFRMMANWNMEIAGTLSDYPGGALTQFLELKQWVVELKEYNQFPDVYVGLELPPWIQYLPQAWLIVPLLHQSQLYGFVILANPRAKIKINWENRDLLITTGRQAASYLALLDTTEALMDARQFEAFNRLSAYVVHDLKNVAAQLGLVVKNAAKHKNNPAFMEDAISTVENAVNKMGRMLAQLRKSSNNMQTASRFNLVAIAKQVVERRKIDTPAPTLTTESEELFVVADCDRLAAVIEHMIQNAQDATDNSGYVSVDISTEEDFALIKIADNGIGMDAKFIQERLFRPFDTTKGNAGMGIGVYESKEFITAIGGRFDVTSEPNKGTTFFIRINLKNNHSDELPLQSSNIAMN